MFSGDATTATTATAASAAASAAISDFVYIYYKRPFEIWLELTVFGHKEDKNGPFVD